MSLEANLVTAVEAITKLSAVLEKLHAFYTKAQPIVEQIQKAASPAVMQTQPAGAPPAAAPGVTQAAPAASDDGLLQQCKDLVLKLITETSHEDAAKIVNEVQAGATRVSAFAPELRAVFIAKAKQKLAEAALGK